MFVCKICGNPVESGQAFCGKCGADVVENYETVCPACNVKNGAGSRYCAHCGGILTVMAKPICFACGHKNLPGAKFCVVCGAPITEKHETHSCSDMLEIRNAKLKLDNMERERIAAVDKEVEKRRKMAAIEREQSMLEVESYRTKSNEELAKQSRMLDDYRNKLNELGSEDLTQLSKVSQALKNYSIYYSDPYSEIDEDIIAGDTYVCPACGTVNPLNVMSCTHCGRSKARATLLLAKSKIKQSPPIKRKKDIIPAPYQDVSAKKTPTFDEYAGEEFELLQAKPIEIEEEEEKVEAAPNFSGPSTPPMFNGYPYPYPQYPYPQMPQYGAPTFFNGKPGEPYQMPPIVQPVAFVPYVTQEQPLMQYAPSSEQQKK